MSNHWCTYCQGHNTHNCQFNLEIPRVQTYTANNTATPQRSFDYKEHAEGLQRDYDLLLAEYNELKAQRTWVSLTDEERFEVAEYSDCFEDVVDLVEAKLKEKNT